MISRAATDTDKQLLSMPPGPVAGHQQTALLREGDAIGVSGVCGEK